jgi:hypothetical protein
LPSIFSTNFETDFPVFKDDQVCLFHKLAQYQHNYLLPKDNKIDSINS